MRKLVLEEVPKIVNNYLIPFRLHGRGFFCAYFTYLYLQNYYNILIAIGGLLDYR